VANIQTDVSPKARLNMNFDSPNFRIGIPRLMIRLLGTVLLFGPAATTAQEKPAAELVSACVGCHGANGIAIEPDAPHLDGQPEPVLIEMITSLQQTKRPTKVKMHRDVATADIVPLARHYAEQKARRPKSATNPELVAHGETLYQNRCAKCHMDNGRDSDKGAPLMAAQKPDYLVAQMQAFKSGQRKFPFLMDDAYLGLSDEELAAIANFFAAQDQVAPQQTRRRRR
jgi:sulfide dehydrogenase cytochrome subunit